MMEHAYTKATPLGRLTVLEKQKQCDHNAPNLSWCQSNCAALCFFFSWSHSFKAVPAASTLSWVLAAFIKMLMELPSWHISMGQIHSLWPFSSTSVWLPPSIHQLLLNNTFFTHSCSLTIVVCVSFLLCFSFSDFLLCYFSSSFHTLCFCSPLLGVVVSEWWRHWGADQIVRVYSLSTVRL